MYLINIEAIQAGILHVLSCSSSSQYITCVEVVLVIRGFALLSTNTHKFHHVFPAHFCPYILMDCLISEFQYE